MPEDRGILRFTTRNLFRLSALICLVGALAACGGSSNTRTSTSATYYSGSSYDAYYRSGINRHHYNHYRHRRPVARPVRRR